MTNVIHPAKVVGRFRAIKTYSSYLLLLFYLCAPWLRWQREVGLPDQAIMIDLPNRKGYLFGIEIWPDEVFYITAILICAALGLFIASSISGRIWCGFACPHTVFTDFFIKIEAFFQGDRNARIKLATQPLDFNIAIKKGLTYLSWLLLSFVFAFGWVGYFYDVTHLVHDIVHFQVSQGGLYWLIGLTCSTYFFAGYARSGVCEYICPYGRFQSGLLDKDSYIVTYHDWRVEPRAHLHDISIEQGDCIDCQKCVHVCPMGIDIRDGLQLKCIGCGLCIDACNSVMQKLNRPLGLINFDSQNSTIAKKAGLKHNIKILRGKTILFLIVFIAVGFITIYSLINKEKIKLNILYGRNALYTVLPDGARRNDYVLKFFNKSGVDKHLIITVVDENGKPMEFMLQFYSHGYSFKEDITLKVGQEELATFVKYNTDSAIEQISKIYFVLVDKSNNNMIKFEAPFISGDNKN